MDEKYRDNAGTISGPAAVVRPLSEPIQFLNLLAILAVGVALGLWVGILAVLLTDVMAEEPMSTPARWMLGSAICGGSFIVFGVVSWLYRLPKKINTTDVLVTLAIATSLALWLGGATSVFVGDVAGKTIGLGIFIALLTGWSRVDVYIKGISFYNEKLAKVFIWIPVALIGVTGFDVFRRFVFGIGSTALIELEWHLYSATFLLLMAYALQIDGHIRIDICYRLFSRRQKAVMDLLGDVFFLLPFAILYAFNSTDFAARSWSYWETSDAPGGLGMLYIIKTVLAYSMCILALQGFAELLRKLVRFLEGQERVATQAAVVESIEGNRILFFIVLGSLTIFVIFAITYHFIQDIYTLAYGVLGMVMLLAMFAALLTGYPLPFGLAVVSLLFAFAGGLEPAFLSISVLRTFAIMSNQVLMAVPLFIYMGLMLERSGLAADLLRTIQLMFGPVRGGIAIATALMGILLATTVGIIGASVVMMGLVCMPAMLRQGYDKPLTFGTICAAGTLGVLIPPSMPLVIMADMMGQSVGKLFMGAVFPGLILGGLYIAYIFVRCQLQPGLAPVMPKEEQAALAPTASVLAWQIIRSFLAPLVLIISVLGTIFFGIATPTEAAAIGCLGAILLAAANRRLSWETFKEVTRRTAILTSVLFSLLVGANIFSTVFGGLGGGSYIEGWLAAAPGGLWGAIALVMLAIFFLGFFMDFIEIAFIILPILGPAVLALNKPGTDDFIPGFGIWFTILLAVTLQTSYLTPPVASSMFYLKAVNPKEVDFPSMYRGILPFVFLQLVGLGLIIAFKPIVLWLPGKMIGF